MVYSISGQKNDMGMAFFIKGWERRIWIQSAIRRIKTWQQQLFLSIVMDLLRCNLLCQCDFVTYIWYDLLVLEGRMMKHEGGNLPRLNAMPWVLLRIRIWPAMGASPGFSIERFASASSPKILLAYMFAERKPQSPSNCFSGVRQLMLVDAMMCLRYSLKSLYPNVIAYPISWDPFHTYVMFVFTLTLFSHSNSLHMLRNYNKWRINYM